MRWRLRYLAIGAVGFFVIGCSEKADGPPTGPSFHTVISTASGCDVGHTSQLANSFFAQPRQGVVKNLVDLLGSQAPYSSAAKNTGFDIMAQIEGAVNDGTSGDPAVGSNLVNHLLLCMFNPSSEATSYPETFPENFTVSLTPTNAAHGAFGERSDTSKAPVFSRPTSAPYTGIAPPEGSTWQSIIPSDPQRVVFYGRPATPADGQTYDWRSIPHNANFSPNIIIGFCVNPSTDTTAMIVEKNVAVLAFAYAYFLSPPSCSSDLAALGATNPFQLAHRLLRFGTDLLAPRPLMAAVLLTGSGGTKSKCCSKVAPQDVPSAALKFVPDPPFANVQAGKNFAVQVQATAGGLGVNGDCITLTAVNNNGINTTLSGANNCGAPGTPSSRTTTVNNVAGIAQFCVNDPKTGTITLVATGNIENRNDTPSTAKSKKLNVKPLVNVATCTQ
jgi:hypothetical protein